MSKRKPKFEYTGKGYPDYHLLLKAMTVELEKLYHCLWDKRKENQRMRNMGKQVKTAWMLFKLATDDAYHSENKVRYIDSHAYEHSRNRQVYVNSQNANRFIIEYTEPEEDAFGVSSQQTYEDWLMDLRREKATRLMLVHLGKSMSNWREGKTIYYFGLLAAMNRQLQEIRDYLKYGQTWSVTTESVKDLELALSLLSTAQEHIGQNDEQTYWNDLFSLIEKRYRWWYD